MPIFQPPAGAFLTALGQPAPEIIDFSLCFTTNLQGDCFIELEIRTTIQCCERLSLDFEFNHHHRAGRLVMHLLPGLCIAADFAEPGILENRAVELCRLFRFGIKPKARCDLLLGERHDVLLDARLLSFCEIGFELLQGAAPALVHALMRSVEHLLLFGCRVVCTPADGEFCFAARQFFKSEC